MTPQPVESRVDDLETRVTTIEQQLGPAEPADTQSLPIRVEMRAGFSSIRAEMAEQGATLRAEMADQGAALRAEMAEQGAALRREIAEQGAALRTEMVEQGTALGGRIDALSTQMRVLHEDVIGRIALLHEGLPKPRGRKRP